MIEKDPFRPRKAVFLDRDGTINDDVGFIQRVDDLHILPHAIEGLRLLQENDYQFFIITNQSGLARNIFTAEMMEAVKKRFLEILNQNNIRIADYFCCPCHPDGEVEIFTKDSADRKGSPGMILKAAWTYGIDFSSSWMIGDRDDDIRAGRSAGLKTIRIHSPRHPKTEFGIPDFFADNLLEAAKIILENNR
jgi:D-glycero-D-manno-heptose 1,7-bisphosphate phosphatase